MRPRLKTRKITKFYVDCLEYINFARFKKPFMLVYTEKTNLNQALSEYLENRSEIGFVPTMGALHRGHLSLVKKALAENDVVVVSIFVNPTQFDNREDLQKYPRTPEKDIPLLEELGNRVLVYLPTVEDIYGNDVMSKKYSFDNLEHEMEGRFRNGHFDGVGTVISKLFEIVHPTRAYFGEKDFQQLQIIKKLVEKEAIPVQVVNCPIMREDSGLAMSSRNQRLTDAEKEVASLIYKTLIWTKENFEILALSELNKKVSECFLHHPDLKLEYFEIADEQTLKTITIKDPSKKYRAFIAAFVGDVRLIDNIALN